MADLSGMGLDPNAEESTGGYKLLDEGDYKMVIIADRVVDTKKKTGKILELKLQAIDGKSSGDTLVDRLNIVNPNETAQKIGQGQLVRICNLTDVSYPPADTTLLYGKPLKVSVIQESFMSNTSGKELMSNKVSNYNEWVDAPAPSSQQGSAPAENSSSAW